MKEQDALSMYFSSIAKLPLLTAEEEIDLARKAKAGDKEARERLVSGNLRLVIKVAKQYSARALTLADMVAEGNVGLMLAVDRFDPDRGFRFATYAFWWIRQSIGKALKRSCHVVHVAEAQFTVARKLARQRTTMRETLGREPTSTELRHELGLSAIQFATTNQAVATLETPAAHFDSAGDEDGFAVMDREAADPCDVACDSDRRESLSTWLNTLSPRTRSIVKMRFGFDGGEPMMLREIGVKLNLTRERVRQILNRALTETRPRGCATPEAE